MYSLSISFLIRGGAAVLFSWQPSARFLSQDCRPRGSVSFGGLTWDHDHCLFGENRRRSRREGRKLLGVRVLCLQDSSKQRAFSFRAQRFGQQQVTHVSCIHFELPCMGVSPNSSRKLRCAEAATWVQYKAPKHQTGGSMLHKLTDVCGS